MNAHTPGRDPSESLFDYKIRRQVSKQIVDAMTKAPRQSPALNKFDTSRFFLGVYANPLRNIDRNSRRLEKRTKQILSQALRPVGVRKRKPHIPTQPFVSMVGKPKRAWRSDV